MRKLYRREDLGIGVRGKYHAAYQRRTNLVLLQPEVAAAFPDSVAVNTALKGLLKHAGGRMAKSHYPKGLDNRQRDRDGEIRHKRKDTHVGTLRKTYGEKFAENYRADTKLGTVLRKEGLETLDQLLKKR
jgi:hypothetical protein